MKIRIAIVDDQNLFRQTLAMLLAGIPDFELVAESANGPDLLKAIALLEDLPDILLMDMNMPGMDGLELNKIIREKYPEIKVIVLSVHAQGTLIAKLVQSGASAYLVKNCDREELMLAIKSTFTTGYYMNKQTLIALQENNKISSKSHHFSTLPINLTERELEVLKLICDQYASAEIAEKLFLSTRTVEGHRNHLLTKTESRNTAGLVLFAIRHQLITLI
ncbi:response regulator transcription factor [Pedobacter sp. CFBP9032]|uniref:response regulator transcription factor n=1 Tax=Pedobacter sp. CFBP9032 TaxID=3096539 RepID=UPI002A6AF1D9|nr:response regulator transcription factor [Pedobacter sp. CFBP9032]MDY0907513.1 response regulator transcription factor [Pedobacter sp. CFBP9032]